jgi:thiol-disulfide isomerase/thioredoxin
MNRLSRMLVAALVLWCTAAEASIVELAATGQLQVEADKGVGPDTRVYRSVEMPMALLVQGSPYGRPVFITTGPTTARLLEPSRVSPDPAHPDVVRVDTSGPQADYLGTRLDGANLILERDGLEMTLVPTPPVLGEHTLDDLVDTLPEYRRSAARYSPDAKAVARLRSLGQPTDVIVFFGSWCSHCEQLVPRLVRVLQDVGSDSKLHVTFHGVPPPGTTPDSVADAAGVEALPTLIVRRDGKEIARMTDNGWDAPETELVKLVAAPAS